MSKVEVQKTIYLQQITNQLLDSFVDYRRITKLHIPIIDACDARHQIDKGDLVIL